MMAERADEVYSGLRYLCPCCKIPILVGKHSITIDRERIKEEAVKELINAATEVNADAGIAGDKSTGYRAIALPKIGRLRDALAKIEALAEEPKQ